MTQDEIIEILNTAYPKVQRLITTSKLTSEPPLQSKPSIELHRDIYARLSGIEGMEGEESDTSEAQYDPDTNMMYVYTRNMKNEEDVLRALIHEYTHYRQDSKLLKKYRQMYTYDKDPFERQAKKSEENWKMFSQN